MGRRVLVVAEGESERRALPHLVRDLEKRVGLELVGVVVANKALTPDLVVKLAKAAYWATWPRPDKIVILGDANGEPVSECLARLTLSIQKLGDLAAYGVSLKVAAAKWQLEAWFLADSSGLSAVIGRSVGAVDATRPDEIQHPKHHLARLLEGIYTVRDAERIAASISAEVVRSRSPSFASFENAVLNGASG